MWHTDEFVDWLGEEHHDRSLWREKIQPQMKRIAVWALESVQEMLEGRKNSFELFGYDFMVAEDMTCWLIEVNSSPDLSYSTAITERLVMSMLADLPKGFVFECCVWCMTYQLCV